MFGYKFTQVNLEIHVFQSSRHLLASGLPSWLGALGELVKSGKSEIWFILPRFFPVFSRAVVITGGDIST